jgi:putative radical SAM enzyme (TIGR03279 family)
MCPGVALRLEVEHVKAGSPAARAGVKPGDSIVYANHRPVRDALDLYAASLESDLYLGIDRDGAAVTAWLRRRRGEDLGLEMRATRPSLCKNRCVFCFVDQMPPGLRRGLYVKDEDYRLSFLHGNYLTLTNIDTHAEERIRGMHLSPLYVSVHAADAAVRARLLGVESAEPVLDIIDRLGGAGIRFHTQVVIVPGYNDGPVLEETLNELSLRDATILSVSVVPVGLTAHRDGLTPLKAVSADLARDILSLTERFHIRMRGLTGRGMVYAGDEIFLLAGRPVPEEPYYDDYPQIDNGVGLVRILLETSRRFRMPRNLRGKHLVFVTGVLAASFIENLASAMNRRGARVDTVVVPNRLFGPSVTVSGLLSGRDMLGGLSGIRDADLICLPPAVVNPDGLTLDGLSIEDMAATTGIPVMVAGYDFKETIKRISHACEAG